MSNINADLWIMIRRHDVFGYHNIDCESIVHQTMIPPRSSFAELKSLIFFLENIEENNLKIVKLRKNDMTLIPYSTHLHGSTKEMPFIFEIVNIHQFCPVENRIFPFGYVEALELKIKGLEKRIIAIESVIPEVASLHVQEIEHTATHLANQVAYLNRRLEELTSTN